MNYTLKYNPDPGIAYDIVRMLYVKLNATNIWRETLTSIESNDHPYDYIIEHAKLLPDPKPELALFFYIPTNKKTTFMTMIIDNMLSTNFSSFSVSDLYSYLNNSKQLLNDVLSYYLGEQDYSNVVFESLIRLSKVIPDRIKLLLFGFSYNPTAFAAQLSNTISSYYDIISADIQNDSISSKDLEQFTNLLIDQSLLFQTSRTSLLKDSTVGFSLCTFTLDFFIYNQSNQNAFYVTTENTIHNKLNNHFSISPQELLQSIHALNDQYRLSIIRLLKEHGSLSPAELAEKISLSVTATKYHMALLKKANIISIRRNNRSIYYTYNPIGYKNILKALENFEKGSLK
ncbi:MAG: helix-turn-helix transcriptional regulator [Firmicutes bacterium]|nr:helix-turn-helix transcriptional regulator [Bacillota bacterium]